MKLQRNTKGIFAVTIPKNLIKLSQWEKGQELIAVPGKDGCLEIRKV